MDAQDKLKVKDFILPIKHPSIKKVDIQWWVNVLNDLLTSISLVTKP